MEQIGGARFHAEVTGQIDRVAETEEEALEDVRAWLSFLPQSCDGPQATARPKPAKGERSPAAIVPDDRRTPYDIRHLLAELVDGGTMFEVKPDFARNLVTALARIDGQPVAVLATNPAFGSGALDPNACDKGTRLLCLADAFGLSAVILHDSPGFFVGQKQEAARVQANRCSPQHGDRRGHPSRRDEGDSRRRPQATWWCRGPSRPASPAGLAYLLVAASPFPRVIVMRFPISIAPVDGWRRRGPERRYCAGHITTQADDRWFGRRQNIKPCRMPPNARKARPNRQPPPAKGQ